MRYQHKRAAPWPESLDANSLRPQPRIASMLKRPSTMSYANYAVKDTILREVEARRRRRMPLANQTTNPAQVNEKAQSRNALAGNVSFCEHPGTHTEKAHAHIQHACLTPRDRSLTRCSFRAGPVVQPSSREVELTKSPHANACRRGRAPMRSLCRLCMMNTNNTTNFPIL